jgi:urea transporter
MRGVSQVMLQNNAITGLLFLIGIFCNSWAMGVGAILGNLISTTTAYILKFSKDDIENGLYGFNGTLVGIGIFFYAGVNPISVTIVIFGAILSTIIMQKISTKFPAFTSPFVVSSWILILIIYIFNISPIFNPPLLQISSLNLFRGISMSFSQVMFQENILTGVIFFIAIFINSRQSAFYALYGALLGCGIALILSFPLSYINIGLWGYNAVLCGIALESIRFKGFIFATLSIILSVLIYFVFKELGIIALTAPFVLSAWIVLYLKNKKLFKFI